MTTTSVTGKMTPEAYLAIENCAETKSEYIAGTMRAMAGATPEHDDICVNLAREMANQLRATTCRANTSDLRVWIEAYDRYYYPDMTLTCGSRQFELRMGLRALVNPTVIFEVLSATTEAIDRGEKFLCYRELELLSVYVLIAQDTPRVEVIARDESGGWRFTVVVGLKAEILLPVANCTLRLADLYENVELPDPPSEASGSCALDP